MLKKTKEVNQTPTKLEKEPAAAAKKNVEVVPQTHTKKIELCSKKSCYKTIRDKESYEDSQIDKNFNNTVDVIMQKSVRVKKKLKQVVETKTSADNLGSAAIKTIQTKVQDFSSEKPVQFVSNPNEVNRCILVSQPSAIINKQLSLTEPFEKVKCVYNMLNNDQIITFRKYAQEAVRQNKIFTIRGNYNSVRHALKTRGWVEKLDMHRRVASFALNQNNVHDISQVLPKRKIGETHQQFIAKVERNIMSRCVENVPCDFLWTQHKIKADYVEQCKNPNMLTNKLNRAPFTNKENLNALLRDISAFYEEEVADIKFPRCFNVWSPDELNEFVHNFKLTACISYVNWLVDKYNCGGYSAVFSTTGKIPFNSIDFAFKRCLDYLDLCQHIDIDSEDPPRIWEHDWETFLNQHYHMTHDGFKILADPQALLDSIIARGAHILENIQHYGALQSIDGYQNLWIIKPANKCRGRGIHLCYNLKKIINFVNPSIATKSRFVVQKYIERPLIIHQTKFDIRQWFLISSINPLLIWMYKECYLRFSTQEYTLTNYHESVHLTNHAIQKKYTNSEKRDKRLPNENMWDSYSFQAYLRQIGKQDFWLERIYPGMRKAIVAAVLVSQDHMERTNNSFELFGADFMICENFYPWLIEINSNPDLAPTTSVTARMGPQFLEDVIKVMIDRRNDVKADIGNFELIYRQNIPPTPAYMGLNIIVKGNRIENHVNGHYAYIGCQRNEKSIHNSKFFKQRTSLGMANKPLMIFNTAKYIGKRVVDAATISSRSKSVSFLSGLNEQKTCISYFIPGSKQIKSCNNLIVSAVGNFQAIPVKPTPCSTLTRHRSCGPRLFTFSLANSNIQESKLCEESYNQSKVVHSPRNSGHTKTNALYNPASSEIIKEICPSTKPSKCTKIKRFIAPEKIFSK